MMLEHPLEPNLKTILIKVQCTCDLVLQNIVERQGYLINFRQQSLIMVQAQGAVLRVSSDRDDRMGLKSKPQKIPRASNKTPKKSHAVFVSHKNLQTNYTAGICRNYHKS